MLQDRVGEPAACRGYRGGEARVPREAHDLDAMGPL